MPTFDSNETQGDTWASGMAAPPATEESSPVRDAVRDAAAVTLPGMTGPFTQSFLEGDRAKPLFDSADKLGESDAGKDIVDGLKDIPGVDKMVKAAGGGYKMLRGANKAGRGLNAM